MWHHGPSQMHYFCNGFPWFSDLGCVFRLFRLCQGLGTRAPCAAVLKFLIFTSRSSMVSQRRLALFEDLSSKIEFSRHRVLLQTPTLELLLWDREPPLRSWQECSPVSPQIRSFDSPPHRMSAFVNFSSYSFASIDLLSFFIVSTVSFQNCLGRVATFVVNGFATNDYIFNYCFLLFFIFTFVSMGISNKRLTQRIDSVILLKKGSRSNHISMLSSITPSLVTIWK